MAAAIIVPKLVGGPYQIVGATAGVAATTFDPSHKTHCALSNGNLTALHSGGGNSDLNAFSIATNTSSQKVYFELTAVQVTFTNYVGIAQDNTSASRLDTAASSPTKGVILASAGTYSCPDSVDHGAATIPSWTTNDIIDIAFDSGSNKIWFRKNNGAWNASHAGTQDPGTGQGGLAVTNTPSTGPWYAFIGGDAVDGDGFTARFSSSSWSHTAPSGFTQLA